MSALKCVLAILAAIMATAWHLATPERHRARVKSSLVLHVFE